MINETTIVFHDISDPRKQASVTVYENTKFWTPLEGQT
jgi:hypothetical protein